MKYRPGRQDARHGGDLKAMHHGGALKVPCGASRTAQQPLVCDLMIHSIAVPDLCFRGYTVSREPARPLRDILPVPQLPLHIRLPSVFSRFGICGNVRISSGGQAEDQARAAV
jgi:hypothetical protein